MSVADLERLVREAIALSAAARAAGRHPFGALVVAADGRVLARAGNESAAGDDPTAHAETVAIRRAAAAHGTAALAGGALVSSAEPWAMCAGAAYWAGLSRVAYGLSETRLRAMTDAHPESPPFDLPCRAVFASGQCEVEVTGPLLEDEAGAVHDGFWSRGRGAPGGGRRAAPAVFTARAGESTDVPRQKCHSACSVGAEVFEPGTEAWLPNLFFQYS